jgi:hypothetical protein
MDTSSKVLLEEERTRLMAVPLLNNNDGNYNNNTTYYNVDGMQRKEKEEGVRFGMGEDNDNVVMSQEEPYRRSISVSSHRSLSGYLHISIVFFFFMIFFFFLDFFPQVLLIRTPFST